MTTGQQWSGTTRGRWRSTAAWPRGLSGRWRMTHPRYFPPGPPPCPGSPGQLVTHPAGSSPVTPLPRQGQLGHCLKGGPPAPAVCLFLSVSWSLPIHLSLSVSLLAHSVCVSGSCVSLSPQLPPGSLLICHFMFPLSASPLLGSIFRHLLVWGEFSGQRWQEPRAKAGGLGGGRAGQAGLLPPRISLPIE